LLAANIFGGVHVAQSLVFYIVFCGPSFCPFSFGQYIACSLDYIV
jgi:hypothetical protein